MNLSAQIDTSAGPAACLRRCTLALATYAAAAMIVALILNSNLLVRLSVHDDQRIGMPLLSSRTDASDNYVYFSLLKRGVSACRNATHHDGTSTDGNALACTYIGGLFAGNVLWEIADAIVPSKRLAVSLLMILNTAALAFAFLLAFFTIRRRHFTLAASIVIAGATLYVLDSFAASFALKRILLQFREILGGEPGFVRLVNPSLFWAFGLATLAALLASLRHASPVPLSVALLAGVLCGLSGLAVTANLIGGIGLFVLIRLVTARKIEWKAAAVGVALTAGIVYVLLQFMLYHASDLGKSVQHGEALALKFNPAMLWLLVPITFGRVCDDRRQNLLLKCILFVAMVIGLVCESFTLGDRLWLRGTVAFALLIAAAWLWYWIGVLTADAVATVREAGLKRASVGRRWRGAAAAFVAAVVFMLATLYARPPRLDYARGFLDTDKYDALAWLDGRVKAGMTVASTNIEDDFLLDFYTDGSPYVPLFGLTTLSETVIAARYVSVLGEIENGGAVLEAIRAVRKNDLFTYNQNLKEGLRQPYDYARYQPVAFYLMLLYYPFTQFSMQIFDGEQPGAPFLAWLAQCEDKARATTPDAPRYDYLIVRASEALRRPERFDVAYRNKSYIVLRPTDRKAP